MTPTPNEADDAPGGDELIGVRLSSGRWLCYCAAAGPGKVTRYKANPDTLAKCKRCGGTRPIHTPPIEDAK